jgi:hypothetical protein
VFLRRAGLTMFWECQAGAPKGYRESRLAHQIPIIDNDDLARLKDAIAAQSTGRDLSSRHVPEFATGGYMTRDGLAKLHAREVILNARQQQAIGQQTLANAGVPGLSCGNGSQPQIVVELTNVNATKEQSETIIGGVRHPDVRKSLGSAINSLVRYA